MNFLATWITTLCLDAPIVALAWQELYSETTSRAIGWHHRILIFIAVWLGYAADRWLDSRRHRINKTHRHLFFSNHRPAILCVWLVILVSSITFSLYTLTAKEFITGCLIAIASAGLTFLIQTLRGPAKPFIKSLSTSLLVLVSAGLFTVFTSEEIDTAMGLALLSTFALYMANCVAIQHWDKQVDRIQEYATDKRSERLGFRLYLIALGQLSLGAILLTMRSPLIEMPLAALLSLAFLYPLDTIGQRLPMETRRLAADASLLTPFILLFF